MAKKNKAPKFDAQSELSTLITSFLTRADEAGKTLEDVVSELQGGSTGAASDFDRDAVIAEIAALKIKGCAKKTLNKKSDEELAELYAEHVTPSSDDSGSDSDSDASGSDSDSASDSDEDGSGSDSDSDGSSSDSDSDEDGSGSDSDSDASGSDSDSDASGSDSESDSDASGSDSESDSDASSSDSDSDEDTVSVADMREYLVANKIEKKGKVKKLSDDEVEELYTEHAESDSDEGSEEDGSWESDED